MIEVMVNNLLCNEESRDKLIELVWNQWTPEQRQALANEAHCAAMTKVGTIVESRLYKLGTRDQRPNLFANHVHKVVMKTFEAEKVEETVTAVVKGHLDEAIAGLKDKMVNMTTELVKRVVIDTIGRIDGYVLRDSLRTITAEVKEG